MTTSILLTFKIHQWICTVSGYKVDPQNWLH